MIVNWRMVIRISVLIAAAVILELSFLGRLTILGATPDLIPVVVVCLGLLGGAVFGAVCGFATGMLIDLLLLQTLGVSSLVLLTVGYLAGRFREQFELTSTFTAPLLCGALSLFAATMFGAIVLMLGVETPVSLLIVREIIVKGLLGFLLAIPVNPAIRRILRPGLIDDRGGRSRSRRPPSPLGASS